MRRFWELGFLRENADEGEVRILYPDGMRLLLPLLTMACLAQAQGTTLSGQSGYPSFPSAETPPLGTLWLLGSGGPLPDAPAGASAGTGLGGGVLLAPATGWELSLRGEQWETGDTTAGAEEFRWRPHLGLKRSFDLGHGLGIAVGSQELQAEEWELWQTLFAVGGWHGELGEGELRFDLGSNPLGGWSIQWWCAACSPRAMRA